MFTCAQNKKRGSHTMPTGSGSYAKRPPKLSNMRGTSNMAVGNKKYSNYI